MTTNVILKDRLTPNEISRTAFKKYDFGKKEFESPYGYTHPDKSMDKMCPYCKNEGTDVVIDTIFLDPFKKFYGPVEFTVMRCFCCGAVWSFYDEAQLEQWDEDRQLCKD